jgi:hypothetical protein
VRQRIAGIRARIGRPASADDGGGGRTGGLRAALAGTAARTWAGARRGASTGTVAVLSVALACTLFGAGALGRAAELTDGNFWLWSSPGGQLSRTNPHDGRVDLVTSVPESAGHGVVVTQDDDHLILHDLETGRMTSIDLTEMAFTGRLDLEPGAEHGFFLGAGHGVVVDREAGEVRAVDPATFRSTGEVLKLPAPLVGGEFDANGVLWVGVPSQGTVVGVRIADGTAEVVDTVGVTDPADDFVMTVRDQGPLVVNRSDDTLVEVRGGAVAEESSPLELADAAVPARTPGALVAVTVPGDDALLTLAGPHDGGSVEVVRAEGIGGSVAVPYEGRVYLAADDGGSVRVFEADGREAEAVEVPGAEGALVLEVREGHLFVNAPESGAALVIGPTGETAEVEKFPPPPGPGGTEPGEPGGETPVAPGEPDPSGEPTAAPSPGQPTPAPGETEPPAEEGADPEGADRPADVDAGTEPEGEVAPELPEPTAPPSTDPPSWGGTATGPGAGGTAATPVGDGTAAGGVPGAPVPVTASARDGGVEVDWQPAYSPGAPVDSYVVSWEGGSTTVAGTESSVVVDGLRDGAAYRFQVQAVSAAGYGAAATSEEVVLGGAAPPAPEGLRIEVTGTDAASLRWREASAAVDYVVSADTTAAGGFAVRTTSTTEIDLAGLEPGATYTFTVAARAEGGAQSAAAEADPVELPHLPAPGSVWFAFADDGTTNVYWAPVEGAAEYVVEARDPALEPLHVPAGGAPVTVNGREYQAAAFPDAGNRCLAFTVQAVDGTGGEGLTSEQTDILCRAARQ